MSDLLGESFVSLMDPFDSEKSTAMEMMIWGVVIVAGGTWRGSKGSIPTPITSCGGVMLQYLSKASAVIDTGVSRLHAGKTRGDFCIFD